MTGTGVADGTCSFRTMGSWRVNQVRRLTYRAEMKCEMGMGWLSSFCSTSFQPQAQSSPESLPVSALPSILLQLRLPAFPPFIPHLSATALILPLGSHPPSFQSLELNPSLWRLWDPLIHPSIFFWPQRLSWFTDDHVSRADSGEFPSWCSG